MQERRHVRLGVDAGVCLLPLSICLLDAALHVFLGAIQLRLKEAKLFHALTLAEERIEPALDSVVGNYRGQGE